MTDGTGDGESPDRARHREACRLADPQTGEWRAWEEIEEEVRDRLPEAVVEDHVGDQGPASSPDDLPLIDTVVRDRTTWGEMRRRVEDVVDRDASVDHSSTDGEMRSGDAQDGPASGPGEEQPAGAWIDSLRKLFLFRLRQQYYIEQTLVEVFDDVATAAHSERISQLFADRRDAKRRQIERLETMFEALDELPAAEAVPLLDAVTAERHLVEDQVCETNLLDLVYLNTGIMIEHFEVTTYQRLMKLVVTSGVSEDATAALKTNYDEERKAYQKFTALLETPEMQEIWEQLSLT